MSPSRARTPICLTMIVRNEAHIVCETLASMLPFIADFVIVDTGSTDGTPLLVRDFFDAQRVPGLLFERPWRDFGHNRSEVLALARAHSTSDYLWMMDADDLLVGEPRLEALTLDGYEVRFGPSFEYWRPQIFKRTAPWRYVGVLHEYASCDAGNATVGHLLGDYHVLSRRLGSRNREAEKYARDAEILAAAARAEPENSRHVFYLAQSYFDAGDIERALASYEQRAGMGGWEQEVFYSRFRAAQCRERLNLPAAEVQAAYLDCFRDHPSRAEPLVEAARVARLANDFASAYEHARRALAVARPGADALFVHGDVYDYRAADELAIAAYYTGRHEEAFRLNQELLDNPAVPEGERARIESNRDFSVPFIKDAYLEYDAALVQRIAARPPAAEPRVALSITTCKRFDLFVRTLTSFLNACEDIDLIDRWICVDDNSSDADRAAMLRLFPFLELVRKGPNDKGHARSMNLLRDRVDAPFLVHLEDDWHFFARRRYIGPALEILAECPDIGQVLFNRNYAEMLEDRALPGGHLAASWEHAYRYRVHEHYPPESDDYRRFQAAHGGRLNNAYWPHYSLRPSVWKTAVWKRVSPYAEDSAHFELEYAQRYARAGFRSAFLDGIHCLHIGRLTSERGDPGRPNAYSLNETVQFADARPVRIQVLSSSWSSSEELCRQWNKMSHGDCRWNRVEIAWEDRDVDFYAVFNASPAGARFAAERTIVFQMEPRAGLAALPEEWRDPDPARFFQVRRHAHFPNVSEWHLGRTYDELSALRVEKTKLFSTVTSARTADPGQRLRVDFIHHLERRGLALDVYGRSNEQGFRGYRGALPPFRKDEGLFPYRYTFAAENHAEHNYFSEKIVDAILAECLCFYWGCPNLADHLDPAAFVQLDLGDFDAAAEVVASAIASDEWARRIAAIRGAKRRILDHCQVFPTLERIVSSPRLPATVVINLDRRGDRLRHFRAMAARRGLGEVQRFAAIDGAALAMNAEIRHLFRGNDHNYRRGIVACALSHLQVWRELRSPTLICEDDAELDGSFVPALQSLLERIAVADPAWDLLLLGTHPWTPEGQLPLGGGPVRLEPMAWAEYMGGTFAYAVSPAGAAKLLARAEQRGLQKAIDWFVMQQADVLRAYRANPAIATSPCARTIGAVDTDIQEDFSCLA